MSWFSNKKVVLLGGASFIGSHLAEALIEKGVKSLKIVDNLSSGKRENIQHLIEDGIEFYRDDLRDYPNAFGAVIGQDIVFHLASQHGGRGYVSSHAVNLWNNLELDTTIFRACANAGVGKVIFSSSACVYPTGFQDDIKKEFYLDESKCGYSFWMNADGPYGTEKLVAEMLLDAHVEDEAFKGVSTRSFTVYGPRMGETHAICAFIARSLIKQEPFEIWGTPRGIIRNWTYVKDNVQGALLAAENMDRGAINIGIEERLYPEDALEIIWEYLGWYPDEVKYLEDKPTGPVNRVADATKLKALGWKPSVTFEEGIKKTVDWYCSTHSVEEIRKDFERKLTEI